MHDCVIIGTGPAGLSAALNLKIHNKDFIWFGSKRLSEKVIKAEKIMNYPGIPAVTGKELFARFSEQIEEADLEIMEKTVTNIMKTGDYYVVLANNEAYKTKTVILCAGVMSARAMEHEDKMLGKGVSYCATCDGMFYRNQKIAVISNDPKFEHEVEYLADLASEVTFFPSYRDVKIERDNVTISKDAPVAVNGEDYVSSLTLRSEKILECDGVFCLRNAIAPSTLMKGIEMENGHIVVNRKMETNFRGCFAAGDCTGRPYQYTKAVGEGNVAAHSCIEYLAEIKNNE